MILLRLIVFCHSVYHLLRWSYLWQLKEYRLDRLRSFFRLPVSGKTFLVRNFWPLEWRRPRFTIKIIFTLITLLLPLSWLVVNGQLAWLILADLLLPVEMAMVLILLALPTWLGQQLLVTLASRKLRRFPRLIIIGVTGSFGKTGTKEAVASVLSAKYKVLKTAGTQNTLIAIAKTILWQLQPYHQVFVVEMGAYRRGEIKAMCNLVKPQIGILTGINEQHLDLFGSLANTQAAKYELIESLPETGLAIFKAHTSAALVVAKHLGISRSIALTVLQSIKADRINQFTRRKITFLDDSYSSNPAGFHLALDRLGQLPGKKLVITPGIIELGSASDRIHRHIGQHVASLAADVLLTQADFAPALSAGLRHQSQLWVFTSPRQARQFLHSHRSDYQAILLEGRLPSIIKSLFI